MIRDEGEKCKSNNKWKISRRYGILNCADARARHPFLGRNEWHVMGKMNLKLLEGI